VTHRQLVDVNRVVKRLGSPSTIALDEQVAHANAELRRLHRIRDDSGGTWERVRSVFAWRRSPRDGGGTSEDRVSPLA
jgi:hypothetical protein